MELYEEILLKWLQEGNGSIEPCKFVEVTSYQALAKIKTVLEDDSLDDPECFQRIEQIIGILEELGSGAGIRHDFG